mmetsp:Transcript_20074/g.50009  ORF Transcript_20074/g.50009 Transcript_20074/m.50009 type:complete len:407 (-) Transcript_20074:1182-2402(-)
MDAKLSSASTISDACLATAVPDPMAMPMLARRRAGASFTPSPVIATTCPCALRSSTSRDLCWGSTRLNTVMFATASSWRSSLISSNSSPWKDLLGGNIMPVTGTPFASSASWVLRARRLAGCAPRCAVKFSSPRPICDATASAVVLLSPVTITTRIPAERQVAMARATSVRGGSIIPTKPRKVRSRSSSGDTVACLAGMGRIASASTRSDPRANFCRRSLRALRTASFMGSAAPLPLVSACVHRCNTASGAPLVKRMLCPLRVANTLISLRSRVKSSAAMRENCPSQYVAQYAARSCLLSCVSALGIASNPGSPIFSASTRSATSVDSPILSYACLSPLYVRVESLHSDEQMARCSTDAMSAGCSTTLPPTCASVMTPSGAYVLPVTQYSVRHSAAEPTAMRPPPP